MQSTVCLILLVTWVSAQSSTPPQKQCAAAMPCFDTCTSGVACTGDELMKGLAGVERAHQMKLMEDDAYAFITKLDKSDFDCAASLINNYCKTGDHATDRQSFIALIKKGCPSSTLADSVDKFYASQIDKVNAIKQQNPSCADVIYTWERSIYKLFNQSPAGEAPNMAALFQQAMQNCVDIIDEIEKVRGECEPIWEKQFPNICGYYKSRHDAMVPFVQGMCRAALKNPEKTRENIQKMMDHFVCKPHSAPATTAAPSA